MWTKEMNNTAPINIGDPLNSDKVNTDLEDFYDPANYIAGFGHIFLLLLIWAFGLAAAVIFIFCGIAFYLTGFWGGQGAELFQVVAVFSFIVMMTAVLITTVIIDLNSSDP
jgi:hypothetical protein